MGEKRRKTYNIDKRQVIESERFKLVQRASQEYCQVIYKEKKLIKPKIKKFRKISINQKIPVKMTSFGRVVSLPI